MLTYSYSYASKLFLQVDMRLLPQRRRLPGQVFCITDDILSDMRLALGLPEDWQSGRCSFTPAMCPEILSL